MTTSNVKGIFSQKGETKSLTKYLDVRASRGCAPVAIAREAVHRVGFLVILDDKRHRDKKHSFKVVSYGK